MKNPVPGTSSLPKFCRRAPFDRERVCRKPRRDVRADVGDPQGRHHGAFGVLGFFAFEFGKGQNLEVGDAERHPAAGLCEAFFFGFFDRDIGLWLEEGAFDVFLSAFFAGGVAVGRNKLFDHRHFCSGLCRRGRQDGDTRAQDQRE